MKTILVPTQNTPTMPSTLETAILLAQRTGAYIEGVPLWFGVPEFVVSELASSFSMETYRGRREEETAEAHNLFQDFMKEHGIVPTRTAPDKPSFGWFAEVPPGDRHQHHDPLEWQHRTGPHQRVRDAVAADRRARDRADGRRRTGRAGPVSRPGAQ